MSTESTVKSQIFMTVCINRFDYEESVKGGVQIKIEEVGWKDSLNGRRLGITFHKPHAKKIQETRSKP